MTKLRILKYQEASCPKKDQGHPIRLVGIKCTEKKEHLSLIEHLGLSSRRKEQMLLWVIPESSLEVLIATYLPEGHLQASKFSAKHPSALQSALVPHSQCYQKLSMEMWIRLPFPTHQHISVRFVYVLHVKGSVIHTGNQLYPIYERWENKIISSAAMIKSPLHIVLASEPLLYKQLPMRMPLCEQCPVIV